MSIWAVEYNKSDNPDKPRWVAEDRLIHHPATFFTRDDAKRWMYNQNLTGHSLYRITEYVPKESK